MPPVIPRPIRKALRSLLGRPSVSFIRRYYSGLASCLLYHRVTNGIKDLAEYFPNIGLEIDAENFETHVRFVAENCRCIDLPTFFDELIAGKLSRDSVLITFDDGYRDNATVALPILEKYNVPATVFVTTGFMDRSATLWWYEVEHIVRESEEMNVEWRNFSRHWILRSVPEKHVATKDLFAFMKSMLPEEQNEFLDYLRRFARTPFSYDSEFMTWEELQTFAANPLITIGAHTLVHPVLQLLPRDRLEHELAESKQILESRLKQKIDFLAYPFGGKRDADLREFQVAKELGYKCAFTTRFGHIHAAHSQHLFALPRIGIDYSDYLSALTWKMSGIDSMVMHRGKRLVTR